MARRKKRKKKKSRLERIKKDSNYLRGNIREELKNGEDKFSRKAIEVLKFHGTYQQDDRDSRKGRDRHYMFMIRTRLPGGGLTGDQYLELDKIADDYANKTMRITTRQTIQFHGVIKDELKNTLRAINDSLVTTLGACGDIVRNVMCNPAPKADGRHQKIQKFADELSAYLLPETNAYHELWLDGNKVFSNKEEITDKEPLYGREYLPRKFKIGIAIPGDNSIDLYTQDIGLVALFDDENSITGYNVIVGGGMGMHHKKPETFPRLGDHLGYVHKDQLMDVIDGIIGIQRDHGNRKNRKQARMKYLIHEWGLDKFQSELENRIGFELEPFKEMPDFELDLYLGWHKQPDGRWFRGITVENGRIKDTQEVQLKTGLRDVIEKYKPGVRLSANQDILLTDIDPEQKKALEKDLGEYGIAQFDDKSGIIKYSMACPALPTCGLAITESERALPDVIRELESVIENLGLDDDVLTVRMTGCPNGCSRPYVADIGFVGRSLNKYSIFIGGDASGTRLNTKVKDIVELEDLVDAVRPLLVRYKNERRNGESFGDYWSKRETDEATALIEQSLEKVEAGG